LFIIFICCIYFLFIRSGVMKIPKREEGQGLVEYALLLVLVAIVIIAILTILGSQVMVVFARVIGGLNGQTITGVGTEAIITGADVSVTGTTSCTATIEDISFVGLQDGNVLENGTVSIAIQANGSTARTVSGSTGANGMGSLAGPYTVSGNCPLTVKVISN
jgi:pilus assembly protein Flp/PilA